MTVELKIKEIREQMGISLRELSEETGIERHRLSEIEDNVDKILFIEMLVIAENLGKKNNGLIQHWKLRATINVALFSIKPKIRQETTFVKENTSFIKYF